MNYKIALITLCYNESKIMPFVIDYWKQFVTHAYVFDNGSTDNSQEILSQYDWISVIDYSHLTGNKLDDIMNMNIKNNFWKTIKDNYDWIVVCDFDECLYCEQWDRVLMTYDHYNLACIIPMYYNMIVEQFPEYIEDKLFHQVNEYYVNISQQEQQRWFSKMLIFNCKKVYELNLAPGSHSCMPVTLANNTISYSQAFKDNNIKCYHLDNMGLDFILNKRRHNREERMTQKQIDHHFAVHYMYDDQKIIDEYNEKLKNKTKLT